MRGNMTMAVLAVVSVATIAACGGSDSGVQQISSDGTGGSTATPSDQTTVSDGTTPGSTADVDAATIARANEVLAMPTAERGRRC